ncbi:hypothetical protein L211DRAFT_839293 [Terfezia boudieri ATCC MYA-4762]|uniref:DUF1772-domain-containing protein n=1 Tax=Terfezia boudieri ATCC MYA-4762 TaxID=1051890 RepID=A0A3N4LMN5_9PEZI|nr:hypothetical protein L211DRAFT_839293 [Terfezia boudieri ATCC MYA-4762]
MPSVLSRESTIVAAHAIALAGSGVLTGGILSLSFFTTPTLLLAPSPLAQKQWSHLYNLGKRTMPFLSLLTSFSYLVLSRLYTSPLTAIVPLSQRKSFLFILSSGLTLSMVPYTMIFMRSTIAGLEKAGQLMKLGGVASGEKGVERGEQIENMKVVEGKNTKQLIDEWGVLNLGRAALTGLGFVVGIWGSMIPVREVVQVVVGPVPVQMVV